MLRHYFSIALEFKEEWFDNARKGNLENMKYIHKIMKEQGIEKDIKYWRGFLNDTIFMRATNRGRQNVLRWLVHELEFDVNEQDVHGYTALHVAASNNQSECARLLLDVGSQHARNRLGKTTLDDANRRRHREMINLLKSHFHILF